MKRYGWRAVAMICMGLAMAPGRAQERALDKQVVVAATLADTWNAWTTRAGITSFFAPDAQIDARAGGAFHIYLDPHAAAGSRGAEDSVFLALQPQQMLSFDWQAPPSLPEVRAQHTFVVVRLRAVDATHTQVSLHHTGWGEGGEWEKYYAYFDHAWDSVLGSLKQRFDAGPKDWSAWLKRLDDARAAAAH